MDPVKDGGCNTGRLKGEGARLVADLPGPAGVAVAACVFEGPLRLLELRLQGAIHAGGEEGFQQISYQQERGSVGQFDAAEFGLAVGNPMPPLSAVDGFAGQAEGTAEVIEVALHGAPGDGIALLVQPIGEFTGGNAGRPVGNSFHHLPLALEGRGFGLVGHGITLTPYRI